VGPKNLSRRTLLRGVVRGAAGVSIGLPLLNAMLDTNGTALAQNGEMAVRFGTFHWGNGIQHNYWRPNQTGTNWALPRNFLRFGELGLQEYVTQFISFNHEGTSPGHIPARGIALSSSHDLTVCQGECVGTYRGQNMPEPSLDALIAEHWGGRTQFESLELGINQPGPYSANSSWKRGGTTYNRHEHDTSKLFNRLFSEGAPPGDTAQAQLLREANAAFGTSMLDAVNGDTESLKKRLGAFDRSRLDQHLDGLRALERRFDPSQTLPACEQPQVELLGTGGSMSERAEVMSDLLAVALVCDQTRLFSFEWSANQSQADYGNDLGISGQHHEDISHNLGGRGDDHGRIITYAMETLAYLANALKNMPEGAGNALDNTLIFATSEHANPNSHDWNDHPLLFVGRAGGRIASGRVIDGGNRADAPKVMLTAVRAVEPSIERLGQEVSGDGKNRLATETIGEAEA
jgi:hypothetical protein